MAGGQVVFLKQGRIASGLLLGPIWAQDLSATAFTTQATSWPVSRCEAILHEVDSGTTATHVIVGASAPIERLAAPLAGR